MSNHNAQQFKFFLPEIQLFQKSFDFPDSLYHVFETRFNARR